MFKIIKINLSINIKGRPGKVECQKMLKEQKNTTPIWLTSGDIAGAERVQWKGEI